MSDRFVSMRSLVLAGGFCSVVIVSRQLVGSPLGVLPTQICVLAGLVAICDQIILSGKYVIGADVGHKRWKYLVLLACCGIAVLAVVISSLQTTVAHYLALSITADGEFADLVLKSLD